MVVHHAAGVERVAWPLAGAPAVEDPAVLAVPQQRCNFQRSSVASRTPSKKRQNACQLPLPDGRNTNSRMHIMFSQINGDTEGFKDKKSASNALASIICFACFFFFHFRSRGKRSPRTAKISLLCRQYQPVRLLVRGVAYYVLVQNWDSHVRLHPWSFCAENKQSQRRKSIN